MTTLIIEISRDQNALKMGAYERSKGIDVTLKHYNEKAITDSEIKGLCEEIKTIFNKAIRKNNLEEDFAKDLKKSGQRLFDQLLTPEVKKTIKNTKANYLLVSIDERLVQIPWELLYDGEEFLCIRFAMGRSVRTKQKVYENKCRDVISPIKMLVVADTLGDLNSAYEEGISIRNELDKRKSKVKISSKTGEVYKDFITKNIRDYDIVHFAGHAAYDSSNPSESGWIFKDGHFSSKEVVELGSAASMPSIVFANACQSGETQEWVIDKDFENEIYGLANAFLLAGTRHYIGTFWKVLDSTCIDFSNEFYKNVTDGTPIGEAVRLARIKLVNKYGYSSIVWSSYMLYGDPAINLFFIPKKKITSQEILFQKQVTILLIILGSIIGTGVLGTVLYRKYFLQQRLKEQILWAHKNTIAVMPFENITKKEEDDWIGRGVADVISAKLSRLEKINAVDRGQIDTVWKGMRDSEYISRDDALKIADTLGADKMIMGTFQKVGEDIRIIANLINVKDRAVVSTTETTDKYDNLFMIEDTVALKVAEKLNIKIGEKERVALKKALTTNNISAFEYLTRAEEAFVEKDASKALELCKKAVEADPKYIKANLTLGSLYEWKGEAENAKQYYLKALELAKNDQRALLAANVALGNLLVGKMGQNDEGLKYQEEALKIAKRVNDQQQRAWIYYNMATAYSNKRVFETAKKLLFESKNAFEALNNPVGLAATYAGLGIYYSFGKEQDLEKTKQYYEESLRIYESLHLKDGMARLYALLGMNYSQRSKFDEGITFYAKSLEMSKEIGDKFTQALAYGGLGDLYSLKKEFGNTEKYYNMALKLNKEINNRAAYRNNLYSLAILYRFQSLHNKALDTFNLLLEAGKEDKDISSQAAGLLGIATIYTNMGRNKGAINKYEEILRLGEEIKSNQFALKETYIGLGQSYQQLDNISESEKYYKLALQVAKDMGDAASIGDMYQRIGRFYGDQNKTEEAVKNYTQSIQYLERDKANTAHQTLLVLAYCGLADSYKKDKKKEEAIEYYKKALPIAEATDSVLLSSIKGNLFNIEEDIKREEEVIENKEAKKLYDQSSRYWAEGEFEKALPKIKEAYNIEPSNKKIVEMLCLIYEDSGRFEEAAKVHLDYIQLLDKKKDASTIVSHYTWLGNNYRHIGELIKAKEYHEKALSFAQGSGDIESLATVYADYSFALEALGENEKAIEFANKAVELSKNTTQSAVLANAYQSLSNIYSNKNDKEKALEYAMLNLQVNEESGSVDLGKSYTVVGSVYKDIDIVKALNYLNKAVDYFKTHNKVQLLGNVYHTIGSVYWGSGQIDKSIEFYNKSLKTSEKLNDKWTTMANYLGLESAYYEDEQYELSEEFREKYISLAKELGKEEELGLMYSAFAVRDLDKDKDKAEKYMLSGSQILEKYKTSKSLKALLVNYNTLGYMYHKKMDYDKAAEYYQRAIDLGDFKTVSDKNLLGLSYAGRGECLRIKGDYSAAADAYKKARTIFVEINGDKNILDDLKKKIDMLEYGLSSMDQFKNYDDLVKMASDYHKEHKWELALDNYKKASEALSVIKSDAKDDQLINDLSKREKWLTDQISRIEKYLKEVESSKKTKTADYLKNNAVFYIRQYKYNAALENLEKALKIYEEADNLKEVAFTKLLMGLVYLTKNDLKNSEKMVNAGANISKDIDNKELKGMICGAFGFLFEKKGEYAKAEKEYHAAIKILNEDGAGKNYAAVYQNCLGSINYKKGNYEEALKNYKEAIMLGQEIEDPNSLSLTNVMMAYVNFKNKSYDDVINSADDALETAERLNDGEIISLASLLKGKVFLERKDYQKARELFDIASNNAELVGNSKLKTAVDLNAAILAEKSGNSSHYEELLSMLTKAGNFGCIVKNKIIEEKVEALFQEIIEEKDFFKRIWL